MIDRVRQFYDSNVDSEWNRLTEGLSAVEYASTLILVDKSFPSTGRVIDIGGGPGRYSIELARRGYQATLFDLSEKLLARAREEFQRAGLSPSGIIQGTATDLSQFGDSSFDAALMLGPLIHLTSREERIGALGELRRVLVPGGVGLVSYLNSWGLIKTGLTDFQSWYDDEDRIRALQHDQVFENSLSGFTDCYWTTPPDASAEIERARFTVLGYAGAESFLAGMAGILGQIKESNRQRYERIVALAAEMAEKPQYKDCTDHLVYIVKRDT